MTTSDKTPKQPPEPAEPITEFEVSDGGTLRMADFAEAETRAEFYEYVDSFWSRSPKDLAEAMDECQPLARAVHSIYSDFRDELEAGLQEAQGAGSENKRKVAGLKAQFEALPEARGGGFGLAPESDHPGSTYYAAELRGDIDEANRAAEAAGIPVRFVTAKQ